MEKSRTVAPTGFGELLRRWRERRRLSQLDLATDAEISTRHLSFIETGRAQPSREMVLLLLDRHWTPHDITLQELRIESFFPADEATDALSRTLAGA